MSANWVFNQKVCLFTFNCFYGKSVSLSSSFLMWNHHRTRRKEDYKHTHTQREREKGERERKTKAAKRCFCSSVKIRQKPPQMMFDFAEVRKVRVKKTNREI